MSCCSTPSQFLIALLVIGPLYVLIGGSNALAASIGFVLATGLLEGTLLVTGSSRPSTTGRTSGSRSTTSTDAIGGMR